MLKRKISLGILLLAGFLTESLGFQAATKTPLGNVFGSLEETTDPQARAKIVESTPRLQDLDIARELPTILAALNNKEPFIRFRAARLVVSVALLRPETRSDLKRVIPVLKKHVFDTYEEWKGAWPQTLLDVIALTDPVASDDNIKTVMSLLYDAEPATSRAAIITLSSLKGCPRSCADALLSKLDDRTDVSARSAVIEGVGMNKLADPRLLEALNQIAISGSKFEQIAVIKTFSQIGDRALPYRGSLETLSQTSSDPDVRRLASLVSAKMLR